MGVGLIYVRIWSEKNNAVKLRIKQNNWDSFSSLYLVPNGKFMTLSSVSSSPFMDTGKMSLTTLQKTKSRMVIQLFINGTLTGGNQISYFDRSGTGNLLTTWVL